MVRFVAPCVCQVITMACKHSVIGFEHDRRLHGKGRDVWSPCVRSVLSERSFAPQPHACTSVAIPPRRTPRSCVCRSFRCTSIAFHPSSASMGFLPSLFPCMHARRGWVHHPMGSCAIERIDGEPGTIRVWVDWEPPLSTLVSAPFSSALVSLVFRRNRTFPIRVRGRGGKGDVLGNVFLFVG